MCSDGTRESRERVGTSIRPRIYVDRRCRPETVPVAGSVARAGNDRTRPRARAPSAYRRSRLPVDSMLVPRVPRRTPQSVRAGRRGPPAGEPGLSETPGPRWRHCHDPACIHASRIDRALSVRPVPSPFGGRGVRAIVLLLDERVEEHAANANGASEQLNGLQRLA